MRSSSCRSLICAAVSCTFFDEPHLFQPVDPLLQMIGMIQESARRPTARQNLATPLNGYHQHGLLLGVLPPDLKHPDLDTAVAGPVMQRPARHTQLVRLAGGAVIMSPGHTDRLVQRRRPSKAANTVSNTSSLRRATSSRAAQAASTITPIASQCPDVGASATPTDSTASGYSRQQQRPDDFATALTSITYTIDISL